MHTLDIYRPAKPSTKSKDYTKTFSCADPCILNQYTPGQWIKPVFHEGTAVPKFQITAAKSSEVTHITRKGSTFVLGFGNPLILLAGLYGFPVELPDFPRNIQTKECTKLAIDLFDRMVSYANKAFEYAREGNAEMNAHYSTAFTLAARTFKLLSM